MPRHVCSLCGYIHYVNPKVIAGCLPVWEDKVLMRKRAIDPRYGLWTLPAGFLEMGETLAQGASREAWEEAYANVELDRLYALYSVPYISQIYAIFHARLVDLNFAAGEESLEVALYAEHEIPWDTIAFPAVHKTLELYFEDRRAGRLRSHTGDIHRPDGASGSTAFDITSV